MKKIRRKKTTNNRGGTKVEYDGIKFNSKLELYCYKKLKENNIYAEYEPTSYTVLEPFVYNDEKIRAITYKPDFVGETFIIETKGHFNESFPLRFKLFKKFLFDNDFKYDLYLPRNQKQVDEVIQLILSKQDDKRNSK